jgi:hypothetical protein
MKRLLIGAVAGALGLTGTCVPAVSAQTACQQILITTTRTASPITATPLDAIAFPVPLTPATSTVVRQIVVCPAGSTPPPAIAPVPVVIGTPVFGAPVVDTPAFGPVISVPAAAPVTPFAPTPAALPRDTGAAAPSPPPAIVGVVPTDTVRGLATEGARYDRMVVTVAGTAAAVEQATDPHGAPFTLFRLEAQGASVGVVVWGHSMVRAGEAVRVSGPFYASTPFVGPSGIPWHSVIEADTLER